MINDRDQTFDTIHVTASYKLTSGLLLRAWHYRDHLDWGLVRAKVLLRVKNAVLADRLSEGQADKQKTLSQHLRRRRPPPT
jgi:hypothetical protein